ncbi:MAG: YheC/YheD family protein [Oscillospiraceae bacterium]|nr:YheC/YheD family protein [Oscillospiraceae bacterium]
MERISKKTSTSKQVNNDSLMNKQKVGFWVRNSAPDKVTHMMHLFYAAACMYGVTFFSFSAKDVDLKTKTIKGLFWENGEFVKKTTPMPELFDSRYGWSLDRKHPEVFELLKEHGYQVTRRGIGTKSDNSAWLLKEGKFTDCVIDSKNYGDGVIEELLEKYKIIILKPSAGSNGDGIFKLSKSENNKNKVTVHYLTDKTDEYLDDFINKHHRDLFKRKYMVQAFVDSTTLDGAPMDVRLNVARGKNAEWETSLIYIRLGSASYLGTNMGTEQRSSTNAVLQSLKFQLGEDEGKRVFEEIQKFAKEFPVHFQKKLRFMAPELCFDIGIDRNDGNKLKLFEVGVSPGATSIKFSVVPTLNVQFYRYLIDNKIYLKGKKSTANSRVESDKANAKATLPSVAGTSNTSKPLSTDDFDISEEEAMEGIAKLLKGIQDL